MNARLIPAPLAIVVLALPASLTHASLFLQVDFDSDYQSSPLLTQSGFVSSLVPDDSATAYSYTFSGLDPAAVPSGTLSLTVSDSDDSAKYDRIRTGPASAGTFTLSALYRDFIGQQAAIGPDSWDLEFSGFHPNHAYEFTFHSFTTTHGSEPWSQDFSVIAGTAGAGDYSVVWGDGDPLSNDKYSATFTATSDSAGDLTIHQASTMLQQGNTPFVVLNGFEVAASASAMPEPDILWWLLFALGHLAFRRERHPTL